MDMRRLLERGALGTESCLVESREWGGKEDDDKKGLSVGALFSPQ